MRAYPLRGRAIRHSLRSAIAPLRSDNTSYPLRNNRPSQLLKNELITKITLDIYTDRSRPVPNKLYSPLISDAKFCKLSLASPNNIRVFA